MADDDGRRRAPVTVSTHRSAEAGGPADAERRKAAARAAQTQREDRQAHRADCNRLPFSREMGREPPSSLDSPWPPPPAPERRRPRRGSLERPDQRPALSRHLAARRPAAARARLQRRAARRALQPPSLPSAFDKDAAAAIAKQLATAYPIRAAGLAGRRGRSPLVREAAEAVRLHRPARAVHARRPGQGRVHGVNLLATTAVGPLARDDRRHGPPRRRRDGAGRERQRLGHGRARRARPRVRARDDRPRGSRLPYTIALPLDRRRASTAALGAAWFAAHAPERRNVIAVINLDAIAGEPPAAPAC